MSRLRSSTASISSSPIASHISSTSIRRIRCLTVRAIHIRSFRSPLLRRGNTALSPRLSATVRALKYTTANSALFSNIISPTATRRGLPYPTTAPRQPLRRSQTTRAATITPIFTFSRPMNRQSLRRFSILWTKYRFTSAFSATAAMRCSPVQR